MLWIKKDIIINLLLFNNSNNNRNNVLNVKMLGEKHVLVFRPCFVPYTWNMLLVRLCFLFIYFNYSSKAF